MQHQIDALAHYCRANKLQVNRIKTKVMHVNTRNIASPHVFTYDGTPLGNVDSYKYVGAWLNGRGSCDTQAKEVIAKATRTMYMCISKSKRISSRCPPALRALLFKSYVTPHFTYACKEVNKAYSNQ